MSAAANNGAVADAMLPPVGMAQAIPKLWEASLEKPRLFRRTSANDHASDPWLRPVGARDQASIARRILDARADREAIVRSSPVVYHVPGALDDLECRIERLIALARRNGHDLDCLVEESDGAFGDRLSTISLVNLIVGEKIDEIQGLVAAITVCAYKEAREQVS